MDAKDINEILNRYSPLDLLVKSAAFALDAAQPGRLLEVSLAGRQADDSFRGLRCRSVDGSAPVLDEDGAREGRQCEFLIGFDARGIVQGAFEWKPGSDGTPGDVIKAGDLGASSVDFALVTHREWFRPGETPGGVPDWKTSPPLGH